ncbi:MAG: glycosyltransferase family 2 protein [Candidatus Binatia bacterium]
MARVTAVIVHWRDLAETLGCIDSVRAEPGIDVVVVDNGSTEPIAPRIARHAPEVRCVANPVNEGYAGGANRGIHDALARGAEVVLLLNNDARVHAGATAAALAVLEGDGRVAVVGPKVLTREDPGRLWLAWGRVTWRQSLVALDGADVPDGPAWSRERDVDWVAGCAMWMRADALRAIGLLDADFFAYHEEVDWCASAREAGWRVVYCPGAVVTHTGRGSGGGPAAIRIRKYFAARNTVLFARKHGGALARAKLVAFLAATLPLQLLWHWRRGTTDEVWLKIEGLRDALAGRRPPLERLGLR